MEFNFIFQNRGASFGDVTSRHKSLNQRGFTTLLVYRILTRSIDSFSRYNRDEGAIQLTLIPQKNFLIFSRQNNFVTVSRQIKKKNV